MLPLLSELCICFALDSMGSRSPPKEIEAGAGRGALLKTK